MKQKTDPYEVIHGQQVYYMKQELRCVLHCLKECL